MCFLYLFPQGKKFSLFLVCTLSNVLWKTVCCWSKLLTSASSSIMSEHKLNFDKTEHAATLTGSPKITPAAFAPTAINPIDLGLRLPVFTASIDCWGKNEVAISTRWFQSALASALSLSNFVRCSSIRLKSNSKAFSDEAVWHLSTVFIPALVSLCPLWTTKE